MAANVKANPKLKYNQLGNTDMVVSNISLGGAAFGNVYNDSMTQDDINMVVKVAIDSGINFIDTSPWYGHYKSEERLGKALKEIPRDKYYIATKVGMYVMGKIEEMCDFTEKKTEESFKKSLDLLGVDYVDIIQIHELEFCASLDQLVNHTLPALKRFKEQGKARYIGITGYSLPVLKKVVEMVEPGTIDTVLNYCRFNITNQDLLDYMDYFKSKGIGVINASAVAMGLLAGPNCPAWHPGRALLGDTANEAFNHCKENGIQLPLLGIEWVFSRDCVPTTLMSINFVDQLKDNLETVYKVSKPGAKDEIDNLEAVKITRKLFSRLSTTNWENVELHKYWKDMKERNFKQRVDD